MSLLLEALKKAELAKQGARPGGGVPPPLSLEVEPVPAEPFAEVEPAPRPVITRRELPDVSQPLEILSEDLPSASAKREADETPVEPLSVAPPARATEPPPPSAAPDMRADARASPSPARAQAGGEEERDAARQLFEAKEVEYNPRRPFYITIGVLVVAGAGYGGYVWWEMQPKTIYNAAKSAPAPTSQAAQAPVPAPQAGAPAASTPPPAAAAPLAPGAPSAPAAKAALPAGPAETAPTAPKGPVFASRSAGAAPAQAPAAGAPPSASRPSGGSGPSVSITPPSQQVDPVLERAYEAFQRGDLGMSRDGYQTVLQREPTNRDALLGLAAIDARLRNYDTAEARYLRLLELDPRDANAHAGLISLRGQVDPVQSESRLKTLIANNPEATHLYFVLGNQYALQARWPEAQAAYFKAYTGNPDNADFAFNLAVSLDQLRQPKAALQYYARAVALAAYRPGSFDRDQAAARIQELQPQ